ncbi:MAG TPA: DUF6428 family protein [Candidatus Acidoferrum sp.]|nr:DUF6428 family protein [Candidatus Acidoferrum sp.]
MQLSELKKLLAKNASRNIRFILPTGSKIPPHTHVTEVARIDKKYIDCGGTRHTDTVCRLQTWFQDDTDHRLTAGKLSVILEKSASFFDKEDPEVDVEHVAPFVSHFPIEKIEINDDTLMVYLGVKHTACLAEDRCLPPNLDKPYQFKLLPKSEAKKCCC